MRVPYEQLTVGQQNAICDWLRKHSINPDHTPADGFIAEATDGTGEYRIEQFQRHPDGGHLVADGELVRKVVRRLKRPDTFLVPWPEAVQGDD